MNVEFDALLRNGTWTLVPPSPTMNIVGCKWVFRIKRNADGTIDSVILWMWTYRLPIDKHVSLTIDSTNDVQKAHG